MIANENNLRDERNDQPASKPPKGMEGEGMGGHRFGQANAATPAGDDPANPSRYAGHTNAYFNRDEPSEEDTANNNFKAAHQQGEPDYDAAKPQVAGTQERPEQQQVGGANANTPDSAAYNPDSENKPDYGSQNPAEEKDHIET